MNFYIKYMFFSFIIFAVVPENIGLKCWNCRSTDDPKCADPFDNSTVPLTDCTQEKGLAHLPGDRPSMCRRIRQKVNGEWQYIRDCTYLEEDGIHGDERFCVERTGTDNILIEYCTCNSKDGCNTSFTFTPAPILMILALVPVILCKTLL